MDDSRYPTHKREDSGTFIETPCNSRDPFLSAISAYSTSILSETPSLSLPSHLTLRTWRKLNKIPPSTPNLAFRFLSSDQLEPSPLDPTNAPGLTHAILLLTNNAPEKWDKSLVSTFHARFLEKLNQDHTASSFAVGNVIHRRWEVLHSMNNVSGSCNNGILLVRATTTTSTCSTNTADENDRQMRIMKLLPSHAIHPGYAVREIRTLRRFDQHMNVVALCDAYVPDQRMQPHATPWLVTEFCNQGTLAERICEWNKIGKLMPEVWVWHVFQGLVAAVKYLHHGPEGWVGEWQGVAHRDVIPGNIFLASSSSSSSASRDCGFDVKLGDFGCAVPTSLLGDGNTEADLPPVSAAYLPPEGAVPAESTDTYQIGLVLSCLYCGLDTPAFDVSDACFLHQEKWPRYEGYSAELRIYIEACLDADSDERPSAKELAPKLAGCVKMLKKSGKLGYDEGAFTLLGT